MTKRDNSDSSFEVDSNLSTPSTSSSSSFEKKKIVKQKNDIYGDNVMASSSQLFKEEKKQEKKPDFPDFYPSKGLTGQEAASLLLEYGKNEIVEKTKPKWLLYLEQLIQPMPIMIWVAIVVELGIEGWLDAGILAVIQFTNATIGWYELTKAGDAVAALKNSLKPQATVKRDGEWKNLDASLCVPGDLVLLGSGSAIPADSIINEGRLEIDTSAMTGESLPVTAHGGSRALMGATAVRGEVEATVEFTGMNTFFGTTAKMLNLENESSNLQKNLLRLMIVLVCLSIVLVIAVLIFLMVKMDTSDADTVKEILSFCVVVLVASIPIAIEIVTTATLAIGSRVLSEEGAIVTRLAAIEELAGMNVLCSDKTGTLTLNKMVIQDECPCYVAGYNQYEILQAAALAAKWNEPPRDALDTLVLSNAEIEPLNKFKQIDFLPFDPAIKRTEGTLEDPEGNVFKITKGAPAIIAKLVVDEKVRADVNMKVDDYAGRGVRSLSVARCDRQADGNFSEWYMLGIFTFLDPPRPDSASTIERALELGVQVKMLTGDSALIAREVCKDLGMGHQVGNNSDIPDLLEDGRPPKNVGEIMGNKLHENDAYAGVYPEHKLILVSGFKQQGYATGMTGDGVNDAPALKIADVGVAVAGATDAARAAADIVLTDEGLSVLITGIRVAREIFKRIQSFINYRIAATLQLLFFFVLEVFMFRPEDYQPHPEDYIAGVEAGYYFKLPVLLLMIITVLNDGTLISIGYDKAKANKRPDKWNLPLLWTISAVLGLVAMVSSLLLLWLLLDSNDPESSLRKSGILEDGLQYGQIVTAIYLKVSISDFLTLFSSRTQNNFFWSSAPGIPLLVGALLSLFVSTMVACFIPNKALDGVNVMGLAVGDKNKILPLLVWIYCLLWWLAQDICKVLVYKAMMKFNIFGCRSKSSIRHAAPKDNVNKEGVVEVRSLIIKIDNAIKKCNEGVDNFKGFIKAKKTKELLTNLSLSLMYLKNEIERDTAKVMLPGGLIEQFADISNNVDIKHDEVLKHVSMVKTIISELRKAHWNSHSKGDVINSVNEALNSLEVAAQQVTRAVEFVSQAEIERTASFVTNSKEEKKKNEGPKNIVPKLKGVSNSSSEFSDRSLSSSDS